MDRAASFQVAGDRDLQVLEMLVLLLEGEEVAEGLGRMLVAAVAGIDDRDRRIVGGQLGGKRRKPGGYDQGNFELR